MAQAEQHSPKRRDARVVEWTALEMRHTGDCIQGSNPCLSAQASTADWSIQPAALLFSTHLSISPNPPTGKPRPAATSFTVPSPRHFHCGNPHLPTPLVHAGECRDPHKRGHRTAQQKAQARTREHERPVQQDAQPSAAEGTGPHDTKTLTGLFRRDEEAAGSRRLGWRGSLPAVLPCRGMENAARCIGQRSALHLSSQHAASGIAPHCVSGGTEAGSREEQPGWALPEPSATLLFAFRASAFHIRHAATDAFRQKALTLCSYGKADKEIQ